MAIMAMGTVNRRALLLGLLTSSTCAFAGEWEVTPKVSIEENYTDNVNLFSSEEESSLVSQFGLNFDVNYQSESTQFELQSSNIYATYSHNHDFDDDFFTLNSEGRFLLWPDGIAVFAEATVQNQASNSARNALADLVSGDTAQVETYSAGFEYVVDNSDFAFDARVGYSIRESSDNIGERDGYGAQIISYNGNAARNVFWLLDSDYYDFENNGRDAKQHKVDFKVGWITPYKINPFLRYYNEDNTGSVSGSNNSYESNAYGVGFRWLVQPRLYLDISYNKPEDDQVDIDGNPQEEYVNAEINWQPTSRTQIEASFGERFYGESYGLDIRHRNRRLTNTISYVEDVRTFTRSNIELVSQGVFWCPTGFIDSTSCYVQPGDDFNFDDFVLVTLNDFNVIEDDQYSLNKVASWDSTLTLPRTTFTVVLKHHDRENLETRESDNSINAELRMSRKVSGYSDIDLNVQFTEENYSIDTDNERLDQYRRYSLVYNRKLNDKLNAKLGIMHTNRQSNDATLNYKESRLFLSVVKDF